MAKKIAIIGSTGSIGTQTLDVVRNMGLTVTAMAAAIILIYLKNRFVNFIHCWLLWQKRKMR